MQFTLIFKVHYTVHFKNYINRYIFYEFDSKVIIEALQTFFKSIVFDGVEGQLL